MKSFIIFLFVLLLILLGSTFLQCYGQDIITKSVTICNRLDVEIEENRVEYFSYNLTGRKYIILIYNFRCKKYGLYEIRKDEIDFHRDREFNSTIFFPFTADEIVDLFKYLPMDEAKLHFYLFELTNKNYRL